VTGLDPSEAMLQVAREKDCGVAWQQGAAEALPYADGAFELALSVTALEFMPDPAQALEEMFRVVAPGGRLVVGVLNAASPWGRARQREAQEQGAPFRQAHFYMPDEFVALLSAYGRPRWSSSIFFAPSGRGIGIAGLLERLGQALFKGYGALLVGRVDR
jgi:ubiquinone/menaquinone biosynthesis C-methylase UbiE